MFPKKTCQEHRTEWGKNYYAMFARLNMAMTWSQSSGMLLYHVPDAMFSCFRRQRVSFPHCLP